MKTSLLLVAPLPFYGRLEDHPTSYQTPAPDAKARSSLVADCDAAAKYEAANNGRIGACYIGLEKSSLAREM